MRTVQSAKVFLRSFRRVYSDYGSMICLGPRGFSEADFRYAVFRKREPTAVFKTLEKQASSYCTAQDQMLSLSSLRHTFKKAGMFGECKTFGEKGYIFMAA